MLRSTSPLPAGEVASSAPAERAGEGLRRLLEGVPLTRIYLGMNSADLSLWEGGDVWRPNAHASSCSRAGPRGMEKVEGARAPKRCDPVATQGSLAAPAPVLCSAEGAVTSSASRWSRPRIHCRAFQVRGTAGDCATAKWTPLRDGLPCRPLPTLHSLGPLPRPMREHSSRQDARTARACLNRAPVLPRVRRSADASLVGKTGRVWGRPLGRG